MKKLLSKFGSNLLGSKSAVSAASAVVKDEAIDTAKSALFGFVWKYLIVVNLVVFATGAMVGAIVTKLVG